MKGARGKLLYIGKATNLERRVKQYWQKPHGEHIEMMVPQIEAVEYAVTGSVIEALILEANEIRKKKPPFNVLGKDDASFLHLAITNEPYPKPVLIRGYELERMPKKKFKKVFGPYTSASAIRAALELSRKLFGWSDCEPGQKRPCFYHHIKLCPGVCVGKISRQDYAKIIRKLTLFFEGKKGQVMKMIEREMKEAAKEERFEDAARLRNQMYALMHIRDVSVIKPDDPHEVAKQEAINVFGRVEAYDISNIGGKEAVGSMTAFWEGLPKKSWYKRFKIRTVEGANDVAMMKEVLRRRFAKVTGEEKPSSSWAMPDMIVIDGGKPQVYAAKEVFDEIGLKIPFVGLAKGIDRKQDYLVYPPKMKTPELQRVATRYKRILQHVRDEAHRFAISYHRKRRSKKFLKRQSGKT